MEEWRGLADDAARPASRGAGKQRIEPAPMGKYTEISRVVAQSARGLPIYPLCFASLSVLAHSINNRIEFYPGVRLEGSVRAFPLSLSRKRHKETIVQRPKEAVFRKRIL